MEAKIKHLEFIQNTIIRMNSNSFMIKGWAVALVSGLFALAAKDANNAYVLISYFTIPSFWVLDGYFLSQERMYRELYNVVIIRKEDEIDFKMDTSAFAKGRQTLIRGLFSKTLLLFYGIAILATFIVMFLIPSSPTNNC